MFINMGVVPPSALSTAQVDVYVANGQDSAIGTSAAVVRTFVTQGGGLLTGAQAWYFSYTKDVVLHPLNVALAPMGIFTSSGGTSADYTFTSKPPVQLGNANTAWAALSATFNGLTASPLYLGRAADVNTAMAMVYSAAPMIPSSNSFWAELKKVRAACMVQLPRHACWGSALSMH